MASPINEENSREFTGKFKIVSMNVNGLRGTKKRRALFHIFKREKFDIICIQEAHLTKSDTYRINKEWGPRFHMAEGTTDSKGLLTLYGKNINFSLVSLVLASERCLITHMTIDNTVFAFVNVYAPCIDSEKDGFFDSILQHTKHYSSDSCDHLILLGDFNTVLNNKLDIISGHYHKENIVQKFNSTINDLQLTDVWRESNPKRKEFTYSKRSKHKPFIARRLDFILTSASLVPFCKDALIQSLGFSDHKSVSLLIDFNAFKRGNSVYKFNIKLLRNKGFVDEIISEINRIKTLDLDPHLRWEYMKITMKDIAMYFGRSLAYNKRFEKQKILSELTHLESYISENPNDDQATQRCSELKLKLEIHQIEEAEGARLRAGQKWAQDGERCTKLFLNLEKQRANSNTIFYLDSVNSGALSNPSIILDAIKVHFENLYSAPIEPPNNFNLDDIFVNSDGANVFNQDDITLLNTDLSESEVLNALKHSNNGSAPGLDGLPGEFYKFFWKDIKEPLLSSYSYSLSEGMLSKSQRMGLICLHHKGKGLSRGTISNWRPISLTNMDYKLITKVFARRLNSCIDKCIESDQYAFIRGRQISDLIREIDDVLELGKINFPQGIILSLDYAKAFDTLSLSSIRKALTFFGFGDNFIRWINVLLSGRLSCVRNGGYISESFCMERGVRQGCPISPLLFILTLELLARDIRKNDNINGLKPNPESRPMKIKMYADDATLFLKNIIDFREVLSRIKLFSAFSGLCLNKNKCFAMYIGDCSFKGSFRYGIKFTNQIKILGIIFSNEKSTCDICENFVPRIMKLEKMCYMWERRHLSPIGKITILKTFGISQFIYVMQSIGINSDYLKQINTIIFRFIWNDKVDNEKKVIERVKRATVCSSYEAGGLKMIDINKMQDSFYLKWADRLLDGKYADWKSIPLYCFRVVGGSTAFNSNVLGSKFKGHELIKNYFWRKVLLTWLDYKNDDFIATDNTIKLQDPIFNNVHIQYRSNTLFIHSCIKRNMIHIHDFIVEGSIISLERFTEDFGNTAETQLAYNVIYNALKRIESDIDLTDYDMTQSECFLFKDIKVGTVPRKGFYNMINRDVVKPINMNWMLTYAMENDFSDIWCIAYDSTYEVKLRVLQWKILHEIYPTGSLRFKMNLRDSENCVFCGAIDTLTHFFFECPISRDVWEDASKYASCKIGCIIKIEEKHAMLGFLHDNHFCLSDRKYLNLLVLISKHTISKFKFEPIGKIKILFERELTLRMLI